MKNLFKITRSYFSRHIKGGNKKLPKTTAIFNLCPALICPAKLSGECKIDNGRCSADLSEKIYKNVLPYRLRQKKIWSLLTGEKFADLFLQVNEKKRNKFNMIRFDEAGDINSIDDLYKMNTIAKNLPGIPVYTYTARRELLKNFNFAGLAVTVNGSGFMAHNAFTALNIEKDYRYITAWSLLKAAKKVNKTINLKEEKIKLREKIFNAVYSELKAAHNAKGEKTYKCKRDCTQCNVCSKKGKIYIYTVQT